MELQLSGVSVSGLIHGRKDSFFTFSFSFKLRVSFTAPSHVRLKLLKILSIKRLKYIPRRAHSKLATEICMLWVKE